MFIGIGNSLVGGGLLPASTRYSANGFVFDLVAHFTRDEYYYNELAEYEVNGFEFDVVADFNKDIYGSDV